MKGLPRYAERLAAYFVMVQSRFSRAFAVVTAGMLALLPGCTVPADPNPMPTGGSGGVAFAGQGGTAAGVGGAIAGGGIGAGGAGGAGAMAGGGFAGFGAGGVGGAGAGGVGAGAGGAGAGGGGAGGTSGTAPTPTFATFKYVTLNTQPPCVASDCHGFGTMNPLTLADDDGMMHSRLLNTRVEKCGNLPVVTPGNPQMSALITLLKGPCGELPRMPYECTPDFDCVPDNYIAAIEQWVLNGAPP